MEKEMYWVKIYISDSNNIVISQPSDVGDESCVLIHPDQVDTVIKWLQEAKQEMEEID